MEGRTELSAEGLGSRAWGQGEVGAGEEARLEGGGTGGAVAGGGWPFQSRGMVHKARRTKAWQADSEMTC